MTFALQNLKNSSTKMIKPILAKSQGPSKPAQSAQSARPTRSLGTGRVAATKSASALAPTTASDEPKLRRTPEIYKSGIRVVIPEKRRADGIKSNRLKVIAIFLDRAEAEAFASKVQDAKVRE